MIVPLPAVRSPRARFPRGPVGRPRRCGDSGGATKHRGGQTRAPDVAGEVAGIRGAIHPGSVHVSVIFPVRRRVERRCLEHPRQLGRVGGARSVSDGVGVATMASHGWTVRCGGRSDGPRTEARVEGAIWIVGSFGSERDHSSGGGQRRRRRRRWRRVVEEEAEEQQRLQRLSWFGDSGLCFRVFVFFFSDFNFCRFDVSSAEKDGRMEMPETSRLRDRGLKKDRDRDRSGRSKRRRGDRLLHGSNRDRDDAEESSEESIDQDEDDEDEDLSVPVRLPPSSPPLLNPLAASSPQQNNHHHQHQQLSRKTFPPKVVKWKADEMIGFAVPRKARSGRR
ncbi:hypothetical protein B296_00030943 [Ensete ventricosum]|uniref:Uncharacterized protein n=1 Tax=Ensete ventricosum TaxID=4639 RepID=A0A426YXV5_ENSVE|nr:hypothetical protein B296_00030943 [Ensete ventricosum]